MIQPVRTWLCIYIKVDSDIADENMVVYVYIYIKVDSDSAGENMVVYIYIYI